MDSITTGKSPLSLISSYTPNSKYNIMRRPIRQSHLTSKTPDVKLGTTVWVLNHRDKLLKFLKGTLIRKLGNNTYIVNTQR